MKRQMASHSSPIAALSQLLQTDTGTGPTPCLPQQASPKQIAKRRHRLQMARTRYNYMLTYIDSVPLSACVPKKEKFSADYRALVEKVIAKLAENFRDVVLALYKVQFSGDLPLDLLEQLRRNPEKVVRQWAAVLAAMQQDGSAAPGVEAGQRALLHALKQLAHLPGDIEKLVLGLQDVSQQLAQEGPTAILKSLLRQTMATDGARNFLRAGSMADFEALYPSLPLPLALAIEPKDWMQGDDLPCLQDWFFGYLQSAGFNTTLLRGVVEQAQPGCLTLAQLQQKMPIDDAIFQRVLGDNAPTLQRALEWKRLYVVDFHCLQDAKNSVLNGQERFMSAPIVLLYWNPVPPAGYPPGQGVLQPVAIQLAQQHDPESAPIFTPNDSANANDANLLKWKLAKYIVNAMQAIHHESIAHFGECHLAIEPVILATRRQLAHNHPLAILLQPHLRFTIHLNDTARNNLIAPGGVVAVNVGPDLASTLELVRQASLQRRFDDCNPERLFGLRALDGLPEFPFRDDTLLLWQAIKSFVSDYLRLYYSSDQMVQQDAELQGWVNELVSPRHAGFQGMRGLKQTGDPQQPVQIDNLDYLIEVVSYILYLAGPKHAAVNYAQYPLMSFGPCVMGAVYQSAPTRSTVLASEQDCLPWYSPLDVTLYTFSFEYLLSNVQYDRFGHYGGTPSVPYFADPRVAEILADFQERLAAAEAEIRRRNRGRAVPYLFQLPSRIPNSVSI